MSDTTVDKDLSAKMAALGKVGGKAKNKNKGFGSMTPEQRQAVGAKGGKISKRKKKVVHNG